MSAIKTTPADAAFSKCVRERSEWRCERCGAQHGPSSTGLHCSHHERRGHWSIRFNPMNAEALCYGCHSAVGGTKSRTEKVMTEAEYGLLNERKNDLRLAKSYRATKGKGEIAKHYREELAAMQAQRETGRQAALNLKNGFRGIA